MKIASILTGVCAGTLLLSGCMTDEPISQRATEERIELVESGSFKIELLDAKTLVNDDGLLTVDASTLLSRTGTLRWIFAGDPQVTVWYHFDWIDAQGNICPPVQHEMVALPGNIVSFHGVAPDEKYINYRLTISLKGPATEEDNAKKQDSVKKEVAQTGQVNPAGKSQAKRAPRSKKKKQKAPVKKQPEAKAEAKPAAQPAAKAEAKPAAQPAAKAEAKPAAQPAAKAEAKPAAQPAAEPAKQQKLTEPFN